MPPGDSGCTQLLTGFDPPVSESRHVESAHCVLGTELIITFNPDKKQ